MKLFISFVVMLVLFVFMGWKLTPTLISDYKIADAQKITASDVRIEQASCDTKLFVIASCTIKMRVNGVSEPVEQDYLLVAQLDGKPVTALRVPGADTVLTTNIGMDYLTNRIVSYIVFMGLFLVLVVGGLILVISGVSGGRGEVAHTGRS